MTVPFPGQVKKDSGDDLAQPINSLEMNEDAGEPIAIIKYLVGRIEADTSLRQPVNVRASHERWASS